MDKNSVRSGRRLHRPATYNNYPYEPMEPPIPLCSSFVVGEDPEWSQMPPACDACDRAHESIERLRGVEEERIST